MTKAPDYNLATCNAEAIAGLCHKVVALQIVGSDFAPHYAKEIDAHFRQLAARLGYWAAPAEHLTPRVREAAE